MVDETTFFIQRRSARLAGADAGLTRDSVPPELSNQLASLLPRLRRQDSRLFGHLFRVTWTSLGRDPNELDGNEFRQERLLQDLLKNHGEVAEFLDVVEMLLKAALKVEWPLAFALLKVGVDEAFVLARFGYRFVGDEIVEAGTDVENEAVDQAREQLLSDPRFADAEAKFVSALQKATSNRDTDYPEAVHASVSALEEVARELLHDENILLDRALEKLRQQHDLDPNVTEMLKKLYHARGDIDGAAHGAGSSSENLAKYFIHTSAAGMLYLVNECS